MRVHVQTFGVPIDRSKLWRKEKNYITLIKKKRPCEKEMCEAYAKSALVRCPADIGQRLEDGLGRVLSVLDASCTPPFDFKGLMENPVADLPVVYSSDTYPRGWSRCHLVAHPTRP